MALYTYSFWLVSVGADKSRQPVYEEYHTAFMECTILLSEQEVLIPRFVDYEIFPVSPFLVIIIMVFKGGAHEETLHP